MRLLRRPDVEALTGLARSTMYRLIADGDFPRHVKIGAQAVAWRERDVLAWIESREAA